MQSHESIHDKIDRCCLEPGHPCIAFSQHTLRYPWKSLHIGRAMERDGDSDRHRKARVALCVLVPALSAGRVIACTSILPPSLRAQPNSVVKGNIMKASAVAHALR